MLRLAREIRSAIIAGSRASWPSPASPWRHPPSGRSSTPRALTRHRAAPGLTWRQFLHAQAAGILAAGLPARAHRAVPAPVRAGVHRARRPPDAPRLTASPAGQRTVPQARNLALGLDQRFEHIRFLIRDRGPDFTASSGAVFQATGATISRTAVQAPRMNAICERLAGTLRRELFDRTPIFGEAHLRAVLTEYQTHGNTARPHQGIARHVPDSDRDPLATVTGIDTQRIRREPVLGGPINEYTPAV